MHRTLKKIATTVGLLGMASMIALTGTAEAQDGSTLEQVKASGKLRVAIIGGNPPYSIISPSGEPEGYDIDIAC